MGSVRSGRSASRTKTAAKTAAKTASIFDNNRQRKAKPRSIGRLTQVDPASDRAGSDLTPLEDRFCREILVDLDGAEAYRRASGGKAPKGAKQLAYKMLQREHVRARIRDLMAKRAERTEVTADMVLQRWWLIANADPNELIEYRRTCCRYCDGVEHGYQMTSGEFTRRRGEAETAWAKRKTPKPSDVFTFDELGGEGFDARRAPHPECPECFGEGVGTVFGKDTRNLGPGARALYAGVKRSKDGFEVLMLSQTDALTNVARHLGMFIDRHEHEVGSTLEQILATSMKQQAVS